MTRKQEAFIQEYLVDLNAAAAARRAGYARDYAPKLMGKPHVRQAVQAAMDARAKDAQNRAGKVLAELDRVAFAEASDESGSKLKVTSKLRALELLGKHMGLFEPGAAGAQGQVTIVEDVGECKMQN